MAEVMNVIGDIEGKSVIIVDDMIDTAGTITMASRVMLERGRRKYMPVRLTGAVRTGSGAAFRSAVARSWSPIPFPFPRTSG